MRFTNLSLAPERRIKTTLLASALLCASASAQADAEGGRMTAPLKDGVPYAFVVHNGRSIKVERDIEKSFAVRMDIRGTLITNASDCPPFCLLPMQLDIPVATVGETEIVDFMQTRLRDKAGVLVDVRSMTQYRGSTIPGSINIFVTEFLKDKDDEGFVALLESFGAKPRGEVSWFQRQLEAVGVADTSLVSEHWDFSNAQDLIIWTNGPMDRSAVKAIRALVSAGYPPQKIGWYRGGMPAWQYWGFNTVKVPKRRR